MTPEEFFTKIWFEYPKDLCHGKKGAKMAAQNAAKKIKPEEYDKILHSMKELIRFDRKDPQPDRWPHLSTWLNQGYYDRDIDIQEIRQKLELSQCSVDNCDNEVHGPMFTECTDHLVNERHYQDLREAWTRTGIDRKASDLGKQCRDYLRERIMIMGGKIDY